MQWRWLPSVEGCKALMPIGCLQKSHSRHSWRIGPRRSPPSWRSLRLDAAPQPPTPPPPTSAAARSPACLTWSPRQPSPPPPPRRTTPGFPPRKAAAAANEPKGVVSPGLAARTAHGTTSNWHRPLHYLGTGATGCCSVTSSTSWTSALAPTPLMLVPASPVIISKSHIFSGIPKTVASKSWAPHCMVHSAV